MRGGRFLSCRHGAMGVVHLVVVMALVMVFVERFPRKEKKNSKDFFLSSLVKTWRAHFFFTKDDLKDFFLSSLGEKKKAHASLACAFFHGCTTSKNTSITQVRYSCPNSE